MRHVCVPSSLLLLLLSLQTGELDPDEVRLSCISVYTASSGASPLGRCCGEACGSSSDTGLRYGKLLGLGWAPVWLRDGKTGTVQPACCSNEYGPGSVDAL